MSINITATLTTGCWLWLLFIVQLRRGGVSCWSHPPRQGWCPANASLVGSILHVKSPQGWCPSSPAPPSKSCTGMVSSGSNVKLYVLVLEWPDSFCKTSRQPCDQQKLRQYGSNFTIHGLWPADGDGNSIICCTAPEEFNTTKLEPLESNLNSIWPSLKANTPSDKFWEYQWRKHGSCSDLGLVDYFQKAYESGTVASRRVSQALTTADVIPKVFPSGYPANNFREAILQHIKVKPLIRCSSNRQGYRETYLLEIGLCVDLTFNYVDCPHNPPFQNCRKDSRLIFERYTQYLAK